MSNAPKKTVTRDDLRRATAAIKEPSFSSLSLGDQYYTYAKAAADAAESKSDDSERFSMFADTMTSLLGASGAGWGGTSFGYVYSNTNWWVDRGDTSSLCFATVQIEDRLYLCATVPPR